MRDIVSPAAVEAFTGVRPTAVLGNNDLEIAYVIDIAAYKKFAYSDLSFFNAKKMKV